MVVTIVVFVVWLGFSVGTLAFATVRAQAGQAEMEELRQVATEDLPTFVDSVGGATDDVNEEDGARQLQDAAEAFGDANDLVGSPVLKPLWFTPVLGRQLRSVSALSEAAETTAAQAAVAFDELHAVLDSSTETGETRLAAAERTQDVLDELRSNLEGLDLGPTDGLVPQLARARNRFAAEYARVMNVLDVASTAVTGVADFLEGPTRYLVLAANNAEMRAGSGMYLQVGVMDVVEGRFELSDFTPAEDIFVRSPAGELDPDVATNWGWLRPDQEWRNLNLSPRFDQSARIAASMWEALGNGPVDGVIAIDVVGLRHLLEVVGPVDVGETPGSDLVSADSVEKDLLFDQYASFEGDRDARRDRLGAVAKSAFEAFNTRPVSASSLLKVLQTAGAERHVLLWSSVPSQQEAWTALGASGELPQNSMLLSVINRGGNKLDPFLDISADISVKDTDDEHHISVVVTVHNTATEGLPVYVQGPHPRSDLAGGDYLGILALTIPGGSGNIELSGVPPGFVGQDGPTRVVTATLLIPRGESSRLVVEFDLPRSWETIEVQPSGRIPSTSWTAGLLKWQDAVPQLLALDALAEA